jgi:hypothetical protein
MLEQFFMAFCGNDRFFHILRFLHFNDNKNEPDKTYYSYRMLWKMRTIFNNARFQVLTVASMKFRVFWDVLPYSEVDVDQRFRGVYCLHHQGDF